MPRSESTELSGWATSRRPFPTGTPDGDGDIDVDAFIPPSTPTAAAIVTASALASLVAVGLGRLVDSREHHPLREALSCDIEETSATEQVLESGGRTAGGRRERRYHHGAIVQNST